MCVREKYVWSFITEKLFPSEREEKYVWSFITEELFPSEREEKYYS